jgi:hypothetical protein
MKYKQILFLNIIQSVEITLILKRRKSHTTLNSFSIHISHLLLISNSLITLLSSQILYIADVDIHM